MSDDNTDPLAEGVKDYLDVLEGKKPAAEATINGEQALTNEQRERLPYIIALYRMPCTLCKADPPCHSFLPFKTSHPETPWIITAICKDCIKLESLEVWLRIKLMEESE